MADEESKTTEVTKEIAQDEVTIDMKDVEPEEKEKATTEEEPPDIGFFGVVRFFY